MSDDFYPFVDSGDPAPSNNHITGAAEPPLPGSQPVTSPFDIDGGQLSAAAPHGDEGSSQGDEAVSYATRIAIYDDMLSTPRVIVITPKDVRTYLEEITNTVYRCMKEQGGSISLMVIREIVENFIHAHFMEPIISILDGGETIRFADQGPGIGDKERAFEFGVTSADRDKKRYIRGTGAGFPMVQQYLENAGGAVSIEDNLGQGTVVTVSLDPARIAEIERTAARGAAVRGAAAEPQAAGGAAGRGRQPYAQEQQSPYGYPPAAQPYNADASRNPMGSAAPLNQPYEAAGWNPYGYPQQYQAGGWQGFPPQGYGAPAYPQQGQWQGQPYPGAAWAGAAHMQQPTPFPGMPQPGVAPQAGAGLVPAQAGTAQPYVSDRGVNAMLYLEQHGSCGPTDLERAFGSSVPTWSRELDALTSSGLVIKRGQKRMLTDMGKLWLQTTRSQQAAASAPEAHPAPGFDQQHQQVASAGAAKVTYAPGYPAAPGYQADRANQAPVAQQHGMQGQPAQPWNPGLQGL